MQETEKEKEFQLITSQIIAFVGIAYFIIALLSVIISIPKIYVISATISSFFFILADAHYALKTEKNATLWYGAYLFLGICSFIVLPAVSINNTDFIEYLDRQQGNIVTLMGLSLVLILLNKRMIDSRISESKTTRIELEKLEVKQKETEDLAKSFEEKNEILIKVIEEFKASRRE